MRLVDCDVIIRFLDDFADSCGNHQKAVLREVKYALGHLPTIDAEPIKHGYWKKIKSGFDECSVCNYHGSSAFKHCPNCGAKMDLKDHYCDRNKCLQMDYAGKGCAECEVEE